MSTGDLDLVEQIGVPSGWLAVVSVARTDGSVHASVVNAGLLAHPVTGERVVGLVARGDARKVALMRRTGRATVTFRHGFQWVSVEGSVDIAGPDDPLTGVAADTIPALLREVFRGAGGTHDDWDEYDRVMAAERRAAILVHPSRIVTN